MTSFGRMDLLGDLSDSEEGEDGGEAAAEEESLAAAKKPAQQIDYDALARAGYKRYNCVKDSILVLHFIYF